LTAIIAFKAWLEMISRKTGDELVCYLPYVLAGTRGTKDLFFYLLIHV
jgi:hypothetical protein